MSISVALTAVYEPSKLRREKILNSSDRVERQVQSFGTYCQASFGQQLVPHHCDPTYLAEDIWCRQQFIQVFNFLVRNTWLYHGWSPVNRASLAHIIRHIRTFSWRHPEKAEKSVKQTVFINKIGPPFLSTAHFQRRSKDADLCAFQFNFRRRRG